MHMAHHALARWNRAGEGMLDRMRGQRLVDGRIGRLRQSVVAEARIDARVLGIEVVGVDDMAGRAARLAVGGRVGVWSQEPGGRVLSPPLGRGWPGKPDCAARGRAPNGVVEIAAGWA